MVPFSSSAPIQHALAVMDGTQAHPDTLLPLLEPGKLDAALDLAAKPLELFGEDALRLFLGDTEVKGKRAVESVEPDGCDLGPAREKVDGADDAPRRRKMPASPMPASSSSERDLTTTARSRPSGSRRRSIRRKGTARRASSIARTSPVGPTAVLRDAL
jgi:hypothetical protein